MSGERDHLEADCAEMIADLEADEPVCVDCQIAQDQLDRKLGRDGSDGSDGRDD